MSSCIAAPTHKRWCRASSDGSISVLLLLTVLFWLGIAPGYARDLPIFGAHIHYNQPDWAVLTPDQVLAILDRASIRRALVSSTPDDSTLKLYDQAPGRIILFLRPYRSRDDMLTWHGGPSLNSICCACCERPLCWSGPPGSGKRGGRPPGTSQTDHAPGGVGHRPDHQAGGGRGLGRCRPGAGLGHADERGRLRAGALHGQAWGGGAGPGGAASVARWHSGQGGSWLHDHGGPPTALAFRRACAPEGRPQACTSDNHPRPYGPGAVPANPPSRGPVAARVDVSRGLNQSPGGVDERR